jgi:hypothetical protein
MNFILMIKSARLNWERQNLLERSKKHSKYRLCLVMKLYLKMPFGKPRLRREKHME